MKLDLTKRSQRKLVIILATIGATGTAVSSGVWWINHQAPDTSIEVDSWENKHVGLDWVLQFEADEDAGKVHVRVADASQKLVVLSGSLSDQDVLQRAIRQHAEVDTPGCTSYCWQGYALVKAKSVPGWKGGSSTNWVDWYFTPQMAKGGESLVTFKTQHPGIFGQWELATHAATLTYQGTTWGSTYSFHEEPVQAIVFTVDKK